MKRRAGGREVAKKRTHKGEVQTIVRQSVTWVPARRSLCDDAAWRRRDEMNDAEK